MVRPYPLHVANLHFSSVPIVIGLFISIFALVALCAKRGTKSPKRYKNDLYELKSTNSPINYNTPPKSPLATPKRLLTSLSNLKGNSNNKDSEEGDLKEGGKGMFGEGGLWQKNILMGEKCQPLEFSGVIYYDNYGKQVSEMPRSPRVSVAGLHSTFSFPMSPYRSS